jgi:hypothetical protein
MNDRTFALACELLDPQVGVVVERQLQAQDPMQDDPVGVDIRGLAVVLFEQDLWGHIQTSVWIGDHLSLPPGRHNSRTTEAADDRPPSEST